jgi:ADP-ribose pyrophosphatase YjhB (NUDIX family)
MLNYKNPVPTVDIIIKIVNENDKSNYQNNIVLICRKNPPYGWAIPGGFVDYGESLENAAIREAKEETSLDIKIIRQLHTYSEPDRDPRQHTISTVFIAEASGLPAGRDDALKAKIFTKNTLPDEIAFDHKKILDDYFSNKY